jgi:serine/threonine/tyrosine-interacting protein
MSFAHEIVPGLWLGSRHTIIGHRDFLSDNNINIVISALTEDEYDEYMIGTADFVGREWHRLVLDDDPCELIIIDFDFVHRVIYKALRDNKRVLVHCAAGVSRSATLVAAYLMLENNITAEEAINYIMRKRDCINPNDGFRSQLKEIETRFVRHF